MKRQVVFLWYFLSFALYASNNPENQEIQLRIQPVGQVSVQTQAENENKSVSAVTKKGLGQGIYENYCTVCHKDGLAGAPKFRNEHDWKPRLAGKTLDDLVISSIKGLNAMPTKGTCLKCNDENLKAAISYMLPQS